MDKKITAEAEKLLGRKIPKIELIKK